MNAHKCGDLRVSEDHLPTRLSAAKFPKFIIYSAVQTLLCVTNSVGDALDRC